MVDMITTKVSKAKAMWPGIKQWWHFKTVVEPNFTEVERLEYKIKSLEQEIEYMRLECCCNEDKNPNW